MGNEAYRHIQDRRQIGVEIGEMEKSPSEIDVKIDEKSKIADTLLYDFSKLRLL